MALLETAVEGIASNLPLHRNILQDPAFIEGAVDIHHLEHWLKTRQAGN